MNVTGPEHRKNLLLPVPGLEAALDSLLAIAKDFAVASVHSKWPFVGCCCLSTTRISTNIYGHFELFLGIRSKNHAWLRPRLPRTWISGSSNNTNVLSSFPLLSQLGLNYDLPAMTALQIAQLLPPEFNRWKQRAKLVNPAVAPQTN
jgi:hypothetical protein